jgi:hypothetical protein
LASQHRGIHQLASSASLLRRAAKWFMGSVWLRLTLSERNIAIIMTKISILEIALLLVVVMIWRLAAE